MLDLVDNVGTSIRKPVDRLSLAEWNQVMDTHATSAFLCSRAAYPHSKRAGGGKVIPVDGGYSIS